jgi:NAD(P)-dependent dehydrogenase (short-subunit alcohol dehydrogenase family)
MGGQHSKPIDNPAVAEVAAASPDGKDAVMAMATDVSKLDDISKLCDAVYGAFGEVGVLMNNAGTAPGGGPWDHIDRWRRVLDVNLWGVINGVQTFAPRMLEQGTPCAIINTGSKQGITCPPGDTAYNVSKAGAKVLTEALAHSLRNEDGARITAHLLIPGSTFTGMTSRGRTEKPPGAWTPDQVVDMLIDGMNRGDFYIICPDNDVTREIDNRRILWAAQDITQHCRDGILTTTKRSSSSCGANDALARHRPSVCCKEARKSGTGSRPCYPAVRPALI